MIHINFSFAFIGKRKALRRGLVEESRMNYGLILAYSQRLSRPINYSSRLDEGFAWRIRAVVRGYHLQTWKRKEKNGRSVATVANLGRTPRTPYVQISLRCLVYWFTRSDCHAEDYDVNEACCMLSWKLIGKIKLVFFTPKYWFNFPEKETELPALILFFFSQGNIHAIHRMNSAFQHSSLLKFLEWYC